jgi:RNA polymerase sigma-70 factor, ECF subfamily
MNHPNPQGDASARFLGDEESIQIAAARKDPGAFGVLFDHYVQPVYRYLLSRLGDIEEAKDLTSQTFLVAFESLSRYQHKGYFSAWLFSIARSKYVDFIRKSSKINAARFDHVSNDLIDPLQQIIETERSQKLQNLIRNLPGDEKELLHLRYSAKLSFTEVAITLGRNEEAVKKSLYRLLARLQNQLEDKHE